MSNAAEAVDQVIKAGEARLGDLAREIDVRAKVAQKIVEETKENAKALREFLIGLPSGEVFDRFQFALMGDIDTHGDTFVPGSYSRLELGGYSAPLVGGQGLKLIGRYKAIVFLSRLPD